MMSSSMLLLMMTLGQLTQDRPADPSDINDESLRRDVAAAAKEFVERCKFSRDEAAHSPFVLHLKPILRWSNPTAGKVFGEVFVWTDNGRPQVIASWYRWFSPDWGRTLEVCSLAEGRVCGQVENVRFWNSETPGSILKPLQSSDPPVSSATARLVQMRRLASEFAASLDDTRGVGAGVRRQLRLLTQPVFRYPAATEQSAYVDGAIFAFVEGTDPEAFLMLEASKTHDASNWQYALVRMNSDSLRVTFRSANIWTAPKIEDPLNLSSEPYALISLEHGLKRPTSKGSMVVPATKAKP